MKAISPTGSPIVGSADWVPGNALIEEGSWKWLPDGSFDFEWVGETVLCWDGQYTRARDGKDLYVDEDGEEWTADEIRLVANDYEPGGDPAAAAGSGRSSS
jgi:hypothetical protein